MISSVISRDFPYLQIHAYIGDSYYFPDFEFDTDALVDTGFSGGLSVPPSLITPTLSPVSQTIWTLADDLTVTAPTYRGYVRVDSLPVVEVEIIALAGQSLLGRGATNHFRLIFDHGDTVTIEL
jgi:predicted aspartyl protease